MNQLKICYWNANGLSQHRNEIEHFLLSNEIDILLVSETHFTTRNCFRIRGYSTYDTKHPSGRACGGTALIVLNKINHHPMPEYRTEHIQATSIAITGTNVVISSIYCPPRHNITKDQYIDFFATLGIKFLVAGDYNAKHPFWGSRLTTPKGRQLLSAISSANLDVISGGQPTYWPSDLNKTPDLIDFGVVRNIRREQISVYSSVDLSSDHSPTILTLFDVKQENPHRILPNKHTNWTKYKKYVSSHLSEKVILKTADDIENAVLQFTDVVISAVRVSTAEQNKSSNSSSTSNSSIEALVSEKRKARREWQRHRSPDLKSKLKDCEKRLKTALKSAEEFDLIKYLKDLDPTERTDYSLYKATRKMRHPIAHESPLRIENGSWAKSTEEKLNAFANHLENVFTPNSGSSSVYSPVIEEIVPSPLRIRFPEVVKAVKDLNLKKAPGGDGISGKMVKELPLSTLRLVLYIFNAILRVGYFPLTWKRSEIVMIPKPGKDPTQVKSYRPISLLSILSKLFEAMLLRKITPHICSNNIIPDHQFGFRKGHSTTEQVHRIVTHIRCAFENREYCSALFIDISQAFDKVWHEGLLCKICDTLPTNTHKLLKNYLSNRSFEVKSKGIFSSTKKIHAGVPQGSILGPILYIIYTSDMPTSSQTCMSTFADDTALVSIHKNRSVASDQLQSHIHILETWLDKWRMSVNANKCTHVTFSLRRDTCPPVIIFNSPITQTDHVRYLGIHLDRRLTWSHHIASKITQMKLKSNQLHWLIGQQSALELGYKVLLYKTAIKPIWTYGIQLWGTACASNVCKLQRRQSKILRTITGAPWFIRNDNIHRDLNIPTVQEEVKEYCQRYVSKLRDHPNTLARELLNFGGHSRLRKRNTLDLIH